MEGISISRILGLPTWESQEKHHLGVAPMVNYREYYKGEVGGFPQVRVVVSFISLCMPVAYLCTKSVPIMH
jgi:hypothetical protein